MQGVFRAGAEQLENSNVKAKLGMSPIAWWNDDLVELSDDVSLEECLRQSRSAGFTGMEKGRRFPDDPSVMLPILRAADVTARSRATAPSRWRRSRSFPTTR
jgi:sugar phosphate isomerase/epimerase